MGTKWGFRKREYISRRNGLKVETPYSLEEEMLKGMGKVEKRRTAK